MHGINKKYLGYRDDHDNPVLELWAKLDGYEGNATIINQVNESVFFVQMKGNPSITGYVQLKNDIPYEDGWAFSYWYSNTEGGTVLGFKGDSILGVRWNGGDEGYFTIPWTVNQTEANRSNDTKVYISFNSDD